MELEFKIDTKHRKQWFTGISFSHPAKMSLPLQLWLIEHYTKVGETILDPMAGSGTALVACSLGRNVIAIELEQKFIDMMSGNFEKIKQRGAQMGYSFGEAQIIQGDARNLEGLLADKIITSPPYASGGTKADENPENYIRREEARLELFPMRPKTFVGRYSGDPDNIGNLPYGQVFKIITGPPYAESMHETGSDEFKRKKAEYAEKHLGGASRTSLIMQHSGEQKSSDNLANLFYGNIDSIITSPPYSLTVQKGHEGVQAWKVIEGLKGADNATLRARSKELAEKGIIVNQYGESPDNIGNLKSTTYLEAMLQVYKSCFAVLRDNGLMILVVKNFIRQKKVVRLDTDTIKLCEEAGFSYLHRHYRKLPSQSFWRILYHKKHPEVEQILYEDILVFKKGG